MFGRLIATVVALFGYGSFYALYNPAVTLAVGKAAGNQFAPSDAAYLQTSYLFSAVHGLDIVLGSVLAIILAVIWFKPIKSWFTAAAIVALLFVVGMPNNANAYYDQKDFTEAYTILPNESAFWIPDVGDNKI